MGQQESSSIHDLSPDELGAAHEALAEGKGGIRYKGLFTQSELAAEASRRLNESRLQPGGGIASVEPFSVLSPKKIIPTSETPPEGLPTSAQARESDKGKFGPRVKHPPRRTQAKKTG
jgi:hypothetical protein